MFRNDQQRGEVCFILTAWVRGSPWKWTETGYRPGAKPDGLSSGEAAMCRFALALWSGDDLPVWQGFDHRRMRDIAELMLASLSGPEGIDQWIRKRSNPELTTARSAWEADVRTRSRT